MTPGISKSAEVDREQSVDAQPDAAESVAPPTVPRPSVRWSVPGRGRTSLLAAVALLLVVPTVVGYLFSASQSEVYAARTELVIAIPEASNTAEQQTATLVSMLDSRALLEPVAAEYDMEIQELQERIGREQVEGGNVLRVTVQGTDRDRALSVASTLAGNYVNLVTELGTDTARPEYLADEIARLTAQQAEIRARLLQLSGSALDADVELARQLRGDSDALQQRIADLEQSAVEMEAQRVEAVPLIRLLGEPYLLAEPVSPQPLRAAAAGLLVGIVLSAGLLTIVLRRRTLHDG